jgi:hypothetical protein
MQPGIQTHCVIHLPQNGFVYGIALYGRHGAGILISLPVGRMCTDTFKACLT